MPGHGALPSLEVKLQVVCPLPDLHSLRFQPSAKLALLHRPSSLVNRAHKVIIFGYLVNSARPLLPKNTQLQKKELLRTHLPAFRVKFLPKKFLHEALLLLGARSSHKQINGKNYQALQNTKYDQQYASDPVPALPPSAVPAALSERRFFGIPQTDEMRTFLTGVNKSTVSQDLGVAGVQVKQNDCSSSPEYAVLACCLNLCSFRAPVAVRIQIAQGRARPPPGIPGGR